MDILIFAIGLVIFVTYMYFLVRMINRAHKQQEREQGRYNYKKREKLGPTKEFVKKYKIRKIEGEKWDS
tara:strand:- start:587 stop:793 length:207 start_codon:yes stop_codon:yes gene_type:complete